MHIRFAALLLTPLLLLAGLAFAQTPAAGGQKPADTAPTKAGGTDAKIIAFQKPSYPLDTCPISKEKLGSMGEPVDMVVDGQLVRLCCGGCKKGVEKDKAAIVKSIQDAVVVQQSVGYPMDKCALCSMKMEKPVNHVVGTRLVRLCSAECAKAFDGDPMKSSDAMTRLDGAWISSQKARYVATTCPVSGEALGEKAVDQLYGVRLVRLCCKGCVKELEANPQAVIAKLDAELKKPAGKPAEKPADKKGG